MSIYPKINGLYKRWQKDLHTKDMLPEGVKYGDFKDGEFALEEFEYLFNNKWIWSEKLDGTNIRIYIDNDELIVKGRTDNAQIPQNLFNWIHNWYELKKEKLKDQFPNGVIFYGEGVGDKIQKGNLFGEQHFKLFDVKIGEYWLKKDVVAAIGKQFELDTPPIWTGTIQEAIDKVKTEPRSIFGNFIIEGYVGTPACRLYNNKMQRIMTKIKVKDFVKK